MKNKKNILLIVSTVLSLGINGIFLFSNHALAEEALYATQDRSIGNKDVLIDGNKHYVLWNFSDKRGFGHSNIIPRDYYNSQIDKNIYPKLITTNAITSKGWEWKGKTGGYDFGFEATLNGGTKYVAFLDNVGFKSAKTVNVEIYIIGKKIASAPIKNGINGGHNITEFTTPGSVTESVDVEFRVVTFTDNSGGTYLQTKGDWGFASKNAREAASKYINNDLRYLSKENKIRFLSDLKYFKTDEEIQKKAQEAREQYPKDVKVDIDAKAEKVKSEIDADGTLTAEEKEKQKAGVDQEAAKAKQAIDGAKAIDGINQYRADGIKAIEDQHKLGDSVDNRKETAKADIDAKAEKVKSEIDADGTLTAEEKEKQKAGVDQEAAKAKQAIDGAKAIDGINQYRADGIKAIEDQHKLGDSVDNRKETAKADIDAKAEKVKSEIDADGTLTAEEKEKQKAGVDQEAAKAKQAIDGAKAIDGINQYRADGIKAIEDQHKLGDSVDNRKETAKADIDAKAEKVKSEIDADGTLTAEEKEKQKAGVDQEAAKAKQAIDGAKAINGINQYRADGIKAIEDQHKLGDSVDNRKETAKADIDAKAEKVKSEIDADGTLTAEEKEKQKAGVDQEAAKAKQAIDGAKAIDGINQYRADGIKAIEDQHKLGDILLKVPKDPQIRDTIFVLKKNLFYAEDKRASKNHSIFLPKTGENKKISLSSLGFIGVLGSLIGFVIFKKGKTS